MPSALPCPPPLPHLRFGAGTAPQAVSPVPVEEIDARIAGAWLHDGGEVALLDVRENGQHGPGPAAMAAAAPYSRLEIEIGRLVPRRGTRTVLVDCGDGEAVATKAARRLAVLGYTQVFRLAGGAAAWARAGHAREQRGTPVPGALPVLAVATAQQWLDDPGRTTYLLDVRTADEFATGSLPGAVHAPAGHLLQATGQTLGVHGSRVLLLDDDGVRAPVVALWLRRVGLDAAVVEGGIQAPLVARGGPCAPAPAAALPERHLEDLAALHAAPRATSPLLIDLRPAPAYRKRHARGVAWSIRPRLVADVHRATGGDHGRALLLLAAEEAVARVAAIDLREAGWHCIAWAPAAATDAAGWPQESTPRLSPYGAPALS